MSQMDNFRSVLGLDTVTEESTTGERKKTQAPKPKVSKKSNTSRSHIQRDEKNKSSDGTTLWVSQKMLKRIKLLGMWLDEQGVVRNPSNQEVIEMMLDYFIKKKYPDSQDFVNR